MTAISPSRVFLVWLTLCACGAQVSETGVDGDQTTVTDGGGATVGWEDGPSTGGEGSSESVGSVEGTVTAGGGTSAMETVGSTGMESGSTTGGDSLPMSLRTLFVGNSFISVRDIPGLYAELLSELSPEFEAHVEAVTPGGYKLVQHAEDARTDGTQLAHWLRTGSSEDVRFDTVVLQEQSQVGGFPLPFADRVESIEAAAELAELASARGATVVLYSTWAYMHGDEPNALLGFGSFLDMQDMLDKAYRKMAMELQERGAKIRIAPVGRAFRMAYEDVLADGGDPLSADSEFALLYGADGKHQSLRGAYLAACVVTGTTNLVEVRTLADQPELGSEVSRSLRELCARTLELPTAELPVIRRGEPLFQGDERSGGRFGYNVALSGDARRTMIFASGSIDHAQGSIRVYAREGATWSGDGLALDADQQWREAAMAGEGSRVMIGSVGQSVLSYQREAEGLWVEGASLGASEVDCSHRGMALSGDGERVVLGSARCMEGQLAHRVFRREGDGWVEEANLPVGDEWSASLAFDDAGTQFVVGHSSEGAAGVFVRDDGKWSASARLEPDVVSTKTSGTVVSISGDGQRIALARKPDERVLIYVRRGPEWLEEGRLPSSKSYSDFGHALGFSGDGRVLVVGHPDDIPVAPGASSGSVAVYERDDDHWQPSYLLVPREGQHFDDFGYSLAISDDGTSVLVGAPMRFGHDGSLSRKGQAFLFSGLVRRGR